MERRRETDVDTLERLAIVETQFLNSAIILNQIKTDVHLISESLKNADSSLDRRVSRLEIRLAMVTGAWFALTTVATAIMYVFK